MLGSDGQIKVDMAIEVFAPGQPEKADMVWKHKSDVIYMPLRSKFIVLNVDKVGYDDVQSVRRKAKYMRSC